MRALSASMIKCGSAPRYNLPAEGSKARFIYDTLYEVRGQPLSRDDWRALRELTGTPSLFNGYLQRLRDTWGCDIRRRTLVGEWSGRVYLDYTPEAVAAAA